MPFCAMVMIGFYRCARRPVSSCISILYMAAHYNRVPVLKLLVHLWLSSKMSTLMLSWSYQAADHCWTARDCCPIGTVHYMKRVPERSFVLIV